MTTPIIPLTRPLKEAIARFDIESRKAEHVVQGIAVLASKIRLLHAAGLMPLDAADMSVLIAGLNSLIDEEGARVGCYKAEVGNEVAALTPMGGETC